MGFFSRSRRVLLGGAGAVVALPLGYALAQQLLGPSFGEIPQLAFQKNPTNLHLLSQCPSLTSEMKLMDFISPHVDSFIYTYVSSRRSVKFKVNQTLTLPDGGTIGVDWLTPPDPDRTTPTVVVMHGLTGCTRSMFTHIRKLQAAGFAVAGVNRRGHGTPLLPLTTPKFSVFGDADDLREAVMHIHRQVPKSPIVLLGLCAGAGSILACVANEGEKFYNKKKLSGGDKDPYEDFPVRAALALSPAYHLPTILATMPWIYSKYFAYRLTKGYLETNKEILQSHPGFPEAWKSSTFAEFVERAVPFTGFKSLGAYLEQYSMDRYIKYCAVPTLLLTALDDPVCVRAMADGVIPRIPQNPHIFLVTVNRGSHAGFIQSLWRWSSWMDDASVEFISAVAKLSSGEGAPRSATAQRQ